MNLNMTVTVDLGDPRHRAALTALIEAFSPPNTPKDKAWCEECDLVFPTPQGLGSHRRRNHPKKIDGKTLGGTTRPRDIDADLEERRAARAAEAERRLEMAERTVEHDTATELPPPVQGPPLPPQFPSPVDKPYRAPFDPDQARAAAAEAM